MHSTEKTQVIILLVGALFLIAGIINRRKRVALLRNGVRVEGIVIRIEKRLIRLKAFDYEYYPVVKYLTSENKWLVEEYDTGTPVSTYKEGDKVVVVYNKTNTSKFLIDNWVSRWTPLLCVLIGIALIALAIISLFHTNSISI